MYLNIYLNHLCHFGIVLPHFKRSVSVCWWWMMSQTTNARDDPNIVAIHLLCCAMSRNVRIFGCHKENVFGVTGLASCFFLYVWPVSDERKLLVSFYNSNVLYLKIPPIITESRLVNKVSQDWYIFLWSNCATTHWGSPWLCVRNASSGERRAAGAADRHHPGGPETQPSAALLSRLPRCGCVAAAGGWGEDGRCPAGNTVQLSSQVGELSFSPRNLKSNWVSFSLFLIVFHRDFMDPTMDSTKHILNYLMPILEQVDAELYDFMIR